MASELRRAGRNRFEAKERGALARPSDFARSAAAFGGASSARDDVLLDRTGARTREAPLSCMSPVLSVRGPRRPWQHAPHDGFSKNPGLRWEARGWLQVLRIGFNAKDRFRQSMVAHNVRSRRATAPVTWCAGSGSDPIALRHPEASARVLRGPLRHEE
jgi:hypothetical protein